MSYDQYGQQFVTEDELLEMIHINPEIDVGKVLLEEPKAFNWWNKHLYAGYPEIKRYKKQACTIEAFDKANQFAWHMPNEYLSFDIVEWLVEQCTTDAQVFRVAEELDLYDKRNLLNLLRFLKYMIDTFRENNVVWGVGRGSSVASYVLFLLGVHKIDSMLYDLDVTEFLRPAEA